MSSSSSDSEEIQEETETPKAPELPEKFNFDENNNFYMAPPVCRLFHYKYAAMLAGIFEVLFLVAAVYSFTSKRTIFVFYTQF